MTHRKQKRMCGIQCRTFLDSNRALNMGEVTVEIVLKHISSENNQPYKYLISPFCRPLSVPFQEKGLIWRPCWGWKNMGGSNFCYGSGPLQTQMHPNGWEHMPRIQEQLTELIFVDFSGRGSWFSEGYLSVWRIYRRMYKARLPVYIDMYQFGAFSGINLKLMCNSLFLISSIHQVMYYLATSK